MRNLGPVLRRSSGQSTVEYILLATAVIAAIIVFTTNKDSGLQKQIGVTLNTSINGMDTMSNRLDASHTGTAPVASPPPDYRVDPRG